jgi:cobaltochelatase CobS
MKRKISELFGIAAPDHAVIEIPDAPPSGPVPTADSNYVFDATLLKKIQVWLSPEAPRKNLMIIGHAGVGKTSFILEVAARLLIPVWGLSCSGKTRFEHLIGAMGLADGKTVWSDGPLLAAMRHGGIFLGNEMSRMDAGEQMRLVDVLDKRGRFTVPDTGEVIEIHPSFRFAATGNTGGFGDDCGAYPGERAGSLAFGDRFMKIEMVPMAKELELAMLEKNASALPANLRQGMVDLAEKVRASFVGNGGPLRITISPRALIDWGTLACRYRLISGIEPMKEALIDIVLNGAPSADREVVMDLYDNWMKETATT